MADFPIERLRVLAYYTAYSQATEPAIPAGEIAIWHDTTADRWHFIYGTDGTVAGNKRVEIS